MELQPYTRRALSELADLLALQCALHEFLDGKEFDALDDIEKGLLREQSQHMLRYAHVLTKRIRKHLSA